MQSVCKKCRRKVRGVFKSGCFVFRHCGAMWVKPATFHGKPDVRSDGAKIGGAIGGLIGLANGDIGGSAGIAVGSAIGKLFDRDNGINCNSCHDRQAYPTGRHKYGKHQFQCAGCKKFIYR